MTQEQFSKIAPTLPLSPGIYKYFDGENKLLYVGKARQIRKRVSSYFYKPVGYKTQELVRRIQKIEFTIVNNERDALLLENSLIKEFQPLFNIELKDDKSYPFIVIKHEPFPRIFFTRQKKQGKDEYFGPYTSVAKARETLEFIKSYFPIRTCKLNLTPKNIAANKFKVCLEYHLGNCLGPCEGFQSETEYLENIAEIRKVLKGNISGVMQMLKQKVKQHAEKLEFEKAGFYQTKIMDLQAYQQRSTVVNTKTGTVDVFSILEEGNIAYVNYLAINDGNIFQTKTITLKKRLDETAAEVLQFAISQMRQNFSSEAAEVIVPIHVEYPFDSIKITVPKSGPKKQLLELSEKNVNYFKEELKAKKMLRLEEQSEQMKNNVLQQLQNNLHLAELPVHIECFDNSNFQGSYPVAAMVCFKYGEPDKSNYRRFNIKTVDGINDFASMKEIVTRRYSRLKADETPLPQLVIIDGGKGQLGAALEAISELGLTGKTTLVGLAKNKEEIFFAGDTESLLLPWDSESLKLIRRIRDEVHRFGITFHRNQRSKGTIKNELETIKGIGKQTADQLLKKFRSVKKVKEATIEELAELIGFKRAATLKAVLEKRAE